MLHSTSIFYTYVRSFCACKLCRFDLLAGLLKARASEGYGQALRSTESNSFTATHVEQKARQFTPVPPVAIVRNRMFCRHCAIYVRDRGREYLLAGLWAVLQRSVREHQHFFMGRPPECADSGASR